MPRESYRFSHRQSIGLVFLCTLFGVAAQYFIKMSGMQMAQVDLASLAAAWRLWAGLCLYGVSTALLILALRDGELSLLYPVISLTYVWVTILSLIVFHEAMNGFKVAGISTICCGVAMLGKGRSR